METTVQITAWAFGVWIAVLVAGYVKAMVAE